MTLKRTLAFLVPFLAVLTITVAPASATEWSLGGSPWSNSFDTANRAPACGVWDTMYQNQTLIIRHPNQANAGRYELLEAYGSYYHMGSLIWDAGYQSGTIYGDRFGTALRFRRVWSGNSKAIRFYNPGPVAVIVRPISC